MLLIDILLETTPRNLAYWPIMDNKSFGAVPICLFHTWKHLMYTMLHKNISLLSVLNICRIWSKNITTILCLLLSKYNSFLLQSHLICFLLIVCTMPTLWFQYLFRISPILTNIVMHKDFIYWEMNNKRMVYGQFLSKWNHTASTPEYLQLDRRWKGHPRWDIWWTSLQKYVGTHLYVRITLWYNLQFVM